MWKMKDRNERNENKYRYIVYFKTTIINYYRLLFNIWYNIIIKQTTIDGFFFTWSIRMICEKQ